MSSAMMAAVVSTDTNMRVAAPSLTSEEIMRSARIYWPEVGEETQIITIVGYIEAVEIPTVTQDFEWLIERIELKELLAFVGDQTQKVMMGYGPRSNVLAVRM